MMHSVLGWLHVTSVSHQLTNITVEWFQSCRHWLNGTLVREYSLVQNDPVQEGMMSLLLLMLLLVPLSASAKDLGELSANLYQQNSTANPYRAGSLFAPNGINNPFSQYGSPFSNQSAINPFATDAPRLHEQQGNYRGKLSGNPYDPDSTSNPYGRYGSRFSPDSINNPYGAGIPYHSDSPTNPYGRGLRIEGQ
jgi:hypothetical protein